MKVLVFDGVAACPHTETSMEICLKEAFFGSAVFYFPAFLYTTHQFWRSYVNGNPDLGHSNSDWWNFINSTLGPILTVMTLSENEVRTMSSHTDKTQHSELDLPAYSKSLAHSMLQIPQGEKSNDLDTTINLIARIVIENDSLFRYVVNKLLPDVVYVFNGRNPEAWPCYRYPNSDGPTRFYHERGSTIFKFALFSSPPAYIRSWQNALKEWDSGMLSRQDKLDASLFFQRQRVGKLKNFSGFNERPSRDSLTVNGLNIEESAVFFSSSNYEIYSVPDTDMWNDLGDQFDVATALRDVCRQYRIPLVIRLHPNSGNYDKHVFNSLEDNNTCFIVKAESEISSYRLAESSRYRFTVGSTITWELMYRRLSCGILSHCIASGFPGVQELSTISGINEHLIQPNPDSNSFDVAEKCGAFFSNFGYSYDLFIPESEFRGRFDHSLLDTLRRAS